MWALFNYNCFWRIISLFSILFWHDWLLKIHSLFIIRLCLVCFLLFTFIRVCLIDCWGYLILFQRRLNVLLFDKDISISFFFLTSLFSFRDIIWFFLVHFRLLRRLTGLLKFSFRLVEMLGFQTKWLPNSCYFAQILGKCSYLWSL